LKNETAPQPMHLHGYRFWVMSHGVYDPKMMNETVPGENELGDTETTAEEAEDIPQPSDDEGFTRLHALNLFTKNKLVRNFYHPIMKDSIVIPSGGYAIVRFRADNKGNETKTVVSYGIVAGLIYLSSMIDTLFLFLIFRFLAWR